MEIILAILKPIIDFFTGNATRIKWFVGFFLLIGFGGSVWYITSLYSEVKVENAELKSSLSQFQAQNEMLTSEIKEIQETNQKLLIEYARADKEREQLESNYIRLNKEKNDAIAVFTKEKGRFDTLLEKRGTLVVRYANRATERMRVQFEAIATNDSDEIQD